MKLYPFLVGIGLVFFSCEKDTDPVTADNRPYVYGELAVGFVENAKLKSAFDLVNDFNLEIRQVSGIHYTSKLPYDSLDYVIALLKTKPYFNNGRWSIIKDGNVYHTWGTGKITIVSTMGEMDESSQADWAVTAHVLRLEEQPSIKSFYLIVPEGKEIYWRNKFRHENIVRWAELNYTVYLNPWP